MTEEFDNFLLWEATTKDTIDFKKIYVDMADDLVAGLMLSQIIFWNLPGKDGKQKMRVQKDGIMWLAKGHSEWFDEIRITEWQAPRALKILKDKGLIETKIFKFNGAPTVHIRLLEDKFIELWNEKTGSSAKSILVKDQNPIKQKTRIHSSKRPESLTEITTEITTKKKIKEAVSPPATSEPDSIQEDKRAIAYGIAKGISEITHTALDIESQRKRLFKVAYDLMTADHSPDMESFSRWWYRYDWRGKRGQPPTPEQIPQVWGAYKTALHRMEEQRAMDDPEVRRKLAMAQVLQGQVS